MFNNIDKEIIFKYLERNYPVKRIKHKLKFKRSIVTDNGSVFYLSELATLEGLKMNLMESLKQVFCCDPSILKIILDNFLKTKK